MPDPASIVREGTAGSQSCNRETRRYRVHYDIWSRRGCQDDIGVTAIAYWSHNCRNMRIKLRQNGMGATGQLPVGFIDQVYVNRAVDDLLQPLIGF